MAKKGGPEEGNDLSALGLAVGAALVVYPEPATTATGLAIIAGSLGFGRGD